MPIPLSQQLAAQAVSVLQQCLDDGLLVGGNPSANTEAARRIGIDRGTLRHRLATAKRLYGMDVNIPEVVLPELNPAERRQARRVQDDLAEVKTKLRDAERELLAAEDLRSLAFGLASMPVNPPAWTTKKTKGKRQQETPVLFTSDFQWGEKINSDEVDGINEYSIEIAKKRYRALIDKTIELCFEHTANPNYHGIFYLRGGDSISGAIHQELSDTDELKPNPSIKSLAEQEIAGIKKLADAFGKVHVISVPGNHGRTTIKPRSKLYADTNNDDLLSWFIQMQFEASGDKRVSFYTPRSGDAYFSVGKLKFLMTHGDRIGTRGGTGFIGPAATILRGVHKTRQQYHQTGKHIDYVLMGHYHVPMFLSHCIVNGSLSGFSEYAKTLRVEPEPPSQTLFHVHPDKGIVSYRQIYVDESASRVA